MTDRTQSPVPGPGCFVVLRDDGRSGELGVVQNARGPTGDKEVRVEWGRTRELSWHHTSELRSGFRQGHVVQDRPRSNVRNTLGTGTVVARRQIADRDMVLVQLHRTGESRWLPFESLVRVREAALQYHSGVNPSADAPDRFRLRALAYALDSWNQITGALDRLDVDPLPHQIDLVHRIMSSDHSNWLIADDVGLGKTIEVGLLLAAMKRRRRARRILVVCPAGVVRQWQDEMQYKFGEGYFIYGLDFTIRQPAQWPHYEKVIVSIDRAKSEQHWPTFADSGYWDVIVFDEAHHLSKIEGASTTQRFRLAERLKGQTDSLIFLTGTPHQGKTEQFVNLLSLLRPDLRGRLAAVNRDASVVAELVLRNRKSLVTDAAGKFLFRGQTTTRVTVSLSEAADHFSRALRRYVKEGYAASESGGHLGRAIGFVMTTYRKLASSSIVAIERALRRRLDRLSGTDGIGTEEMTEAEFDEVAEPSEEGIYDTDDLADVSDRVPGHGRLGAFFRDERPMLIELCEMASAVRLDDRKLEAFMSDIVAPLRKDDLKLLVFTEYRGTQEYLAETLENRFPGSGVCQINGGMTLEEKRQNIDDFNDAAAFLVSTEAGGEGINLHANCHVLVNYDLPWNPRRLIQRAGRLYRYGQKERVIVFNLVAKDGFDNRALWMLLDKVSTMARAMSEVSGDYREDLETEIVGELLERVDIGAFLADNREMDIHRSEEEIEDAINLARQSQSQQERLFSHIEGYDPKAAVLHTFGAVEVLAFLEGVLPRRGVRIRNRLHDGRVLELELPEDLRRAHAEFGGRTVVQVTADRTLAMRNSRLVSMDFASSFFSSLIEFAKSPEFGGEYATVRSHREGVLGLYKVRWQDDQGVPRWEALVPVFRPNGGAPLEIDPAFLGSLLVDEQRDDDHAGAGGGGNVEQRREILKEINSQADEELARRCTALRHPNDVVLLAAADVLGRGPDGTPRRTITDCPSMPCHG